MNVRLLVFLFGSVTALVFAEETQMDIFVEPANPALSVAVEPVAEDKIVSDEIQAIIDRMYVIAGAERADPTSRVMVGLAAPQIGVYKQIMLVDVGANAKRELGELKAFINPKITWKSDDVEEEREGCYSVDARVCGIVVRAAQINYTAYDRQGNFISGELSGFAARVFQHEVDHLNGIRFPDRVTQDGGKLHWVEASQFPEYRTKFKEWPVTVSDDMWHAMKTGKPYSEPHSAAIN